MGEVDTVMVIDDSDIFNIIAQKYLLSSKKVSKTILMPSGYSAINYIKANINQLENIPDVVFLDINMPVVTGINFLDFIKTLPKEVQDKMSIIVISAEKLSDELEELYTKEGVIKGNILKPLSSDKVNTALGLCNDSE